MHSTSKAGHRFTVANKANVTKDRFLRAFERLDHNHDGVLSPAEVDEGVVDTHLDADLSDIVAALKVNFREVKDLHNDGWLGGESVITLADILVFEQVLRDHVDEVCPNWRHF